MRSDLELARKGDGFVSVNGCLRGARTVAELCVKMKMDCGRRCGEARNCEIGYFDVRSGERYRRRGAFRYKKRAIIYGKARRVYGGRRHGKGERVPSAARG